MLAPLAEQVAAPVLVAVVAVVVLRVRMDRVALEARLQVVRAKPLAAVAQAVGLMAATEPAETQARQAATTRPGQVVARAETKPDP